jgi:hypothetical protein
MLLEQQDRTPNQRTYHLIIFKDGEVTFGRGHSADIRVTDISVSRLHASLFLEADGSYRLQDRDSKFGTLLLLDSDLILTSKKIGFQIGKSVLTCQLKKKSAKSKEGDD